MLKDIFEAIQKIKNLSQADLAKELEISHIYTSELINNKKQNPSETIIKKFAKAINIPYEQLISIIDYNRELDKIYNRNNPEELLLIRCLTYNVLTKYLIENHSSYKKEETDEIKKRTRRPQHIDINKNI